MFSVRVYSKGSEGSLLVGPHFKVREFACSDGSDVVLINPDIIKFLEAIRTHFGKPVIINSGYRTVSYNKKIKGASGSMHMYGAAADIVIKGVSPDKVADYAEQLMPRSGGIGRYSNFTHIDVRINKSRWKG